MLKLCAFIATLILFASPAHAFFSPETIHYLGEHWWEFFGIFGFFALGCGFMDDSHPAVGYFFFICCLGLCLYLWLHNTPAIPVAE